MLSPLLFIAVLDLTSRKTVVKDAMKKLTQRDSFVYLGGAVCGDGKTEREVRRRVQAGANAWRAVEGVMADRRMSKRLKGKVMSTCVTPVHACTERKPWH